MKKIFELAFAEAKRIEAAQKSDTKPSPTNS
jgi:hypothetical protein